MPRLFGCFAMFAIALASCAASRASAQVCQHCGCQECHKVCRLECKEKKVQVTCWGCKCEDFCLPCPSKPGCKHCESVCSDGECGDCHDGVLVKPKKFVWRDWCPSGAKLHTKKKLMKKTVTVTVPSYNWVVEDICDKCDAKCPGAALPPDGEIPPPPVAGVDLRYRPSAAPDAGALVR
jgi:hypothetical protein